MIKLQMLRRMVNVPRGLPTEASNPFSFSRFLSVYSENHVALPCELIYPPRQALTGHGGTYSQPNGGEFAKVAVAML